MLPEQAIEWLKNFTNDEEEINEWSCRLIKSAMKYKKEVDQANMRPEDPKYGYKLSLEGYPEHTYSFDIKKIDKFVRENKKTLVKGVLPVTYFIDFEHENIWSRENIKGWNTKWRNKPIYVIKNVTNGALHSIDGNHRITWHVENNKKKIKYIELTYFQIRNNDFFVCEYDRVLFTMIMNQADKYMKTLIASGAKFLT